VVLFSLIGVNLAAFVVQLALQASQPAIVPEYLGLSYRGIDQAFAWQFFSAMFLHVGIFSFVASMVVLYFIGRDLESILGQKHFLYLFLGGVIGGELGHLFLMPSTTVLVAASGGIAAVIVAYATILPELEVAESLLFVLPAKVRAKYLGYALVALGLVLVVFVRTGVVSHSAWLGGAAAGWLYAHLLGFGRPSFVQRALRRRRLESERRRQMSLEEFIAVEIDPLLEKISQRGLASLSRSERRRLAEVREKMAEPPQ
jgi:membrane associated rhomboid family serine protease